jgi:dynein heavy chain
LKEIEENWSHIDFIVILSKDIKDFYLVGVVSDIISQLEETQVQLSTIRTSRYVASIKSQVDEISHVMNNVDRVIDDFMKFLIEFLSLFRIFSSPDI